MSSGRARPVVLLCVLLITIVACGGSSGEVTLDDYLGDLAAANHQGQVRGDELEDQLDAQLATASDQEAVEAYRRFFAASTSVVEDIIKDVQDADPPPEIQAAQEPLVESLRDLHAGYEELVADLSGVSTRTEAEELITATIAPVAEAGQEACLEIQAIAAVNNIAVELECGS